MERISSPCSACKSNNLSLRVWSAVASTTIVNVSLIIIFQRFFFLEMPHAGSLLAKLIQGTCVTASELPYSVESSRLRDGFIACCWYISGDTRPVGAAIQNHIKRGYVQGDRQSNERRSHGGSNCCLLETSEDIKKMSNLNGSSAAKSPSLCPPFFCARLKPFYPYIAPGLTVHTAQNRDRRSSTSPPVPLCWACAVAAQGFYWRVISWIEISFQSIQQGTIKTHSGLWGTVLQVSLCSQCMLEVNQCLMLKKKSVLKEPKGEPTMSYVERCGNRVLMSHLASVPRASVWNVLLLELQTFVM